MDAYEATTLIIVRSEQPTSQKSWYPFVNVHHTEGSNGQNQGQMRGTYQGLCKQRIDNIRETVTG